MQWRNGSKAKNRNSSSCQRTNWLICLPLCGALGDRMREATTNMKIFIFTLATLLSGIGLFMTLIMLYEGYWGTGKNHPWFLASHVWLFAWVLYFFMGYYWVQFGKAPIIICLVGTVFGCISLISTLFFSVTVLSAVLMATYILFVSAISPNKKLLRDKIQCIFPHT